MDLQRIVNSQSTQDKKEKAGGFTLSDFKPFYKAIAMKQHGVSEKETHRQMEYNWESRNKPTCVQSTNISQSSRRQNMEKIALLVNGVEKTG